MNIHPIFVHFPIAFLTLYSLSELVWSKWLQSIYTWKVIKFSFLIVGTLGSFVALSTGEIAEEVYGRTQAVEIHSLFATITAWVFALLSVAYIISFLVEYINSKKQMNSTYSFKGELLITKIYSITKYLLEAPNIYILAFGGLILITVTGALGGGLVYGPEVDPLVSFIYKLLIR